MADAKSPPKSKAQADGKPAVAGRTVVAAWAVTCLAAYLGIAPWLEQSVEGIDLWHRPIVSPLIAIVAFLGALVASTRWARGLGAKEEGDDSGPPVPRRRVLKGGAAVVGGTLGSVAAAGVKLVPWITVSQASIGKPEVVKTDPNPKERWSGASVQSYRRLGRTEARVSDISLGSGRIDAGGKGEAIARAAIERGVNYFDTAPDYSAAGSEIALGRAMQGQRDKMFVATKFCTPHGHLQAGASVEEYISVVEGSLERLQTDYVDLVHIHSCNTVERLLDPNVHEAFERLKEAGKARFLGFSSHTPELETVADAAIADGRFDVMMLAYHHGAWPRLNDIIDRAAAADIGVVAMKTLKGAKHHGLEGFRADADAYSQASFKWVLSNPSVSCLVVSFFQHQHVDEYLFASGAEPDARDAAVLERYDEQIAGKHCLPHCGDCLSACPVGLPIDDVLRYRMYFEDYGNEKHAMEMYAKLEQQADACIGCAAPCAGACPHGVPIQERMIGAHRMLTLG